MLPDFIIIGAMKAGTTSLANYVDLHPRIRSSPRKEPHFFSKRIGTHSVAWYESGFDNSGRLQCEASGSYTKFPTFRGVPARMHELLPRIKLIYVLRDPIERIRSHLHHTGHTGVISTRTPCAGGTFENLDTNPYVAVSRYHMQLQQYLPFYPLERILIVTTEEMSQNPQPVLDSVFRFLGVEPFTSPEFAVVHHRSSRRKERNWLGRAMRGAKRMLGLNMPAPAFLKRLQVRDAVPPPTLDDALIADLKEFLRPDVEALRALSGKSFASWSL